MCAYVDRVGSVGERQRENKWRNLPFYGTILKGNPKEEYGAIKEEHMEYEV